MKDKNGTFDGYVITRPEIASGASGVVHEALSPDGARVAIKVLDRKRIEEKICERLKAKGMAEQEMEIRKEEHLRKQIERFKAEYQTLVGLAHPNVAQVHGIGYFDERFYIAQEFIEGKPIADHVRGWLPSDMLPLFIQALEGLDFIHRCGLVHLDIKSANVLVETGGDEPVVKIIDFGIATAPGEYGGAYVGTVPYMAPEVVLGRTGEVDARADLFSMGALMYYCITWGAYPFARTSKMTSEAVRRLVESEELPRPPSYVHASRPGYGLEHLDTVVMRLLAKDPKDRFYGNARAVINALITHQPDAFRERPDARSAYLIPEGSRHIGRIEDQSMLFATINEITCSRQDFKGTSVFVIQGEHGMGKTHLLKKAMEAAQRHVELLAISSISLPANEAESDDWMRRLVQSLDANDRSIAIIVDDAQHADGKSAELLQGLMRRAVGRSKNIDVYRDTQPILLILGLNMPAEGEIAKNITDIAGEEAIRTIPLHPFTRFELREYLSSTPALKGKDIPDAWIEAIYKSTGGIPREVRDHLESLDSKGLIFGPEGSIIVAGADMHHERPPESTRERIIRACSKTARIERDVLDFLAAWSHLGITRPPTFEDLANFFYSPSFAQTTRNLIAGEFIESKEGRIRWRTDYLQKVIYDETPESDREMLHESIAAYIKRDRDAIDLHLAFGGRSPRALRSCLSLARKMIRTHGRAPVACELARRAASLIPGDAVPLRICIACLAIETFYLSGMHRDAERHFEDGMTLIGQLKEGRRAWEIALLLRIIPVYISQRRYNRANDAIDVGLRLLGRGPVTPAFVSLLNLRARNLYEQSAGLADGGKDLLDESKQLYERSERLAASLPETIRQGAASANYLGLVLRDLGRYDDAKSALRRKLSYEGQDILSGITTMVALAETHRMRGEYADAADIARRLIDAARKTGSAKWIIYAHEVFANILHDSDRFDDAIREASRALAVGSCLENDPEYKALSIRLWIMMGHCYKELKCWGKAAVSFTAAIDAGASGPYLMSAHEGLARSYLGSGKFDEALVHIARAEGLLDSLPQAAVGPYRFRVVRLKIEALLNKSAEEEARAELLRLRHLAGGDPKLVAECNELQARFT